MNLWLSGRRQGSIIFIVYRSYSAKLVCLRCIAKRVAVNGVNSNRQSAIGAGIIEKMYEKIPDVGSLCIRYFQSKEQGLSQVWQEL